MGVAGGDQNRRALRNVLLIGASVILVGLWTVTYTEPLPLVERIFGVGGLVAWLTLGIAALKPERREQLRRWFDEFVLKGSCTTRIIMLLWVVAAVAISGTATVELDPK